MLTVLQSHQGHCVVSEQFKDWRILDVWCQYDSMMTQVWDKCATFPVPKGSHNFEGYSSEEELQGSSDSEAMALEGAQAKGGGYLVQVIQEHFPGEWSVSFGMLVGEERAIWWWGNYGEVVLDIVLRVRDTALFGPVGVFRLVLAFGLGQGEDHDVEAISVSFPSDVRGLDVNSRVKGIQHFLCDFSGL